ncbi:hypothetical protein N9917_00795 [Deltaproteobacteria bacterium]|nr:hypothetical protein [Deltaproteobacteria bacterium]
MVVFTFTLLVLREITFILSGLALCYMAFRLFLAGVDSGGAEEMTLGKYLKLKGGGPGLVFVCLGAFIIIYTIAKSGRLDKDEMGMLLEADKISEETPIKGH